MNPFCLAPCWSLLNEIGTRQRKLVWFFPACVTMDTTASNDTNAQQQQQPQPETPDRQIKVLIPPSTAQPIGRCNAPPDDDKMWRTDVP